MSTTKLDEALDKIADICHESYTGCARTSDPVHEWDYSYTNEVVNLLQDPRVKQQIKALMLQLVGQDTPYKQGNHDSDKILNAKRSSRNALRAELREKINQL